MDNHVINPNELNYFLRRQSYTNEADPLFFMEQRGEVPVGTWLAKVEEIKLRYPKT
jgi:hypothetical protein